MSLPVAIPEFVKKIPRRKPRAAAPDAVGGEPLAPAAEPTSAAHRADVESPPAGARRRRRRSCCSWSPSSWRRSCCSCSAAAAETRRTRRLPDRGARLRPRARRAPPVGSGCRRSAPAGGHRLQPAGAERAPEAVVALRGLRAPAAAEAVPRLLRDLGESVGAVLPCRPDRPAAAVSSSAPLGMLNRESCSAVDTAVVRVRRVGAEGEVRVRMGVVVQVAALLHLRPRQQRLVLGGRLAVVLPVSGVRGAIVLVEADRHTLPVALVHVVDGPDADVVPAEKNQ